MRPNPKNIAVLFTICVATGAFALEPSATPPPRVQDPSALPAEVPAGTQAGAEGQTARTAEAESGTVALPPAAVPQPRLVRSA